MANKYSKFKSKIHPLTYVIGALFVVVVIIAIVLSVPSSKDKFYRSYFNTQVRTQEFNPELLIERDHLYKTVNVKKLEKHIESDEVVIVYIGGTWCPYCLNEVNVYHSELKKNEELFEKAGNILYLEKSDPSKDIKGLEALFEKLEIEEVPSKFPTLLVFINGELAEATYSSGTQQPESIRTAVRDFYDEVLSEIK